MQVGDEADSTLSWHHNGYRLPTLEPAGTWNLSCSLVQVALQSFPGSPGIIRGYGQLLLKALHKSW